MLLAPAWSGTGAEPVSGPNAPGTEFECLPDDGNEPTDIDRLAAAARNGRERGLIAWSERLDQHSRRHGRRNDREDRDGRAEIDATPAQVRSEAPHPRDQRRDAERAEADSGEEQDHETDRHRVSGGDIRSSNGQDHEECRDARPKRQQP